mmetsp:Transcript_4486/g.6858  ORF Transcript_4486/g.6858 Transcript_4486/m.6858 type:complete len:100 (-) Transcript_4486:361-660(-)|eukprot:CAMPEP_0196807974 /NCGR_PEP_ID=MMETSP1362-20130617/7948_1 /TAXON_ID=163516 /ORGANISM="Leptocylindrus danicus, Strain CCMP1856" /LENGTH=99 /DNA_ID=CAMNT_0042182101 /DNA_START=15 /DNA_END=314 /DNA_ORIENTATION=+
MTNERANQNEESISSTTSSSPNQLAKTGNKDSRFPLTETELLELQVREETMRVLDGAWSSYRRLVHMCASDFGEKKPKQQPDQDNDAEKQSVGSSSKSE